MRRTPTITAVLLLLTAAACAPEIYIEAGEEPITYQGKRVGTLSIGAGGVVWIVSDKTRLPQEGVPGTEPETPDAPEPPE